MSPVCHSLYTRKALVKTFVKQVIYYPDKIVIVYNFTNKQSRALLTKDQLKTIEGDVLSPSSTFQSLSTLTSFPPAVGDAVLVAKESSSHKVDCFCFSPFWLANLDCPQSDTLTIRDARRLAIPSRSLLINPNSPPNNLCQKV